ncbi:MAG: helix-turn-helix domain-containing protein [Phycisphaerae bacterium]|nr:helix-turn-helix domain-containing protein [Phycisphaerae bacterium]
MDIEYNFGVIKQLRKIDGISQDEFAHKCQLSAQSMVAIENDRTIPSLYNLRKVARVLNLSVEKLINIATKRQPMIIKPVYYLEECEFGFEYLIYTYRDSYIARRRATGQFNKYNSSITSSFGVAYYLLGGSVSIEENNNVHQVFTGDAIYYDAAGKADFSGQESGDALMVLSPKNNPIARFLASHVRDEKIIDPDVCKASFPKSNISFSVIRCLRKCRNKSTADLCREIELSYPALSSIERNESIPTLPTVVKLARALGVSFFDLINFAEINPSHFFEKSVIETKQASGYICRSAEREMTIYHRKAKNDIYVSQSDEIEHAGILTEFALAIKDSIEVEVNGEKFCLQQDEAIVFDALADHAYRLPSGGESIIIHTSF